MTAKLIVAVGVVLLLGCDEVMSDGTKGISARKCGSSYGWEEWKRVVSGIRPLASGVWSLGLPFVLTMETQEGP